VGFKVWEIKTDACWVVIQGGWKTEVGVGCKGTMKGGV
jgi:hypothetical protein